MASIPTSLDARADARAKEVTDGVSKKAKNGGGLPVMAKKTDPGKRAAGVVKLNTNLYGLLLPHRSVFRYHVTITAFFGDRDKPLTKSSRDDYLKTTRNDKCFLIMEWLVEKDPDFFGKRPELVYDLQTSLYSANKLPITDKKRVFRLTHEDLPASFGFDDKCTAVMIEIAEFSEHFEVVLDDYSSAKLDLRNVDRSLQQFLEIATSQEAMRNRQRHLTFGATKNYMLNPFGEGFERNEIATDVGTGKFMGVGADKGVRFIEGPKGQGNVHGAMVIDTKKAAFHQQEMAHVKAAGILKMASPAELRREELSVVQIFMIKCQMKGVFVETENSRTGHQISDIALTSCDKTMFPLDSGASGGSTISVTNYYNGKHPDSPLQFPNLPPLISFRGKKMLYLPMETCRVAKYQRVTIQQQTPEQMDRMIKFCAVAPAVRQRQNLLNMKALELHEGGMHNATCQNFGIRVTAGTLPVQARILPLPKIVYGQNAIVTPNSDGNWLIRGQKPPYILPAKIGVWAIYGVALHAGDRFDLPQLQQFAQILMREAQSRGIVMNNPAECEMLASGVVKEVVAKMQLASQHGATYVIFVQHDFLKFHREIKLLEVKCNVLTQDIKMSVAMDCVTKNKAATIENIVNKINMKNGGINYNIRLETEEANRWLHSEQLIIGIGVSHPPPLLAQEMARNPNAKAKVPTVIGYSANTNQHQVDFVGDYVFQEPLRTEAIDVLPGIMEKVLKARVECRKKAPERIVIFRGAVADSQFKMVLESEVPAIKKGIKEVGGESYKPKLTVVVVQKKHNVRLFPPEINAQAKPADQNIKSGTVVDTAMVHPYFAEFYLNSHRALQGTAKTPHYVKLFDEAEMSADEVQGLAHALCFNHQIVNLAVSVPAPLYIAEEYAKRGRNNFTTDAGEQITSSSDSNGNGNGNGQGGHHGPGTNTSDQGLNYEKLELLRFAGKKMERQRANA